MKIDGKKLIEIIVNRLDDEDIRCNDFIIVNKLRDMTFLELNQATCLGDVVSWHNDRKQKP